MRTKPSIREPPLAQRRAVALLADVRPPADPWVHIRRLALHRVYEMLHYPGRNVVLFARVDVAEEDQMRKEHALVMREAPEQPLPIHLVGARQQEVRNVGAVVAITILHERL